MITATTSSRWIKPPPMPPTKPSSQSTTRTTRIVQSKFVIVLHFLREACSTPHEGRWHDRLSRQIALQSGVATDLHFTLEDLEHMCDTGTIPYISAWFAAVAKWQTQLIQNQSSARTCGFNSHPPHQQIWTAGPSATHRPLTRSSASTTGASDPRTSTCWVCI